MAKTTRLSQTVDPDFANGDHWDNGAPVADDTIGTVVNVSAQLLNRPVADSYDMLLDQGYTTQLISHFLGVGATLGTLTINSGSEVVGCDYDATTCYLSQGAMNIVGNALIDNLDLLGGDLTVAAGVTLLAADPDVLGSGSTIASGGAGAVIDCAAVFGFTDGATINWNSTLTIYGGINAGANTITHQNAAGGTLVCDVAGTLDLGTSDSVPIALTLQANTTQARAHSVGAFTLTSGTFTRNALAFTCTTFAANGGVYAGSGATNVGGNITVGSVGTEITATGLFTMTASGNITSTHYGNRFYLSVATGATATMASFRVRIRSLAGAGGISCGANELHVFPDGDNYWTSTGAAQAAGGGVVLYGLDATTHTNAAAVNISSVKLTTTGVAAANQPTFAFTSRVTCGALIIAAGEADKYAALVANAGLQAASIQLGGTLHANADGRLTLRGTCQVAGNIAAAAGSDGSQLALNGCALVLGGTLDGATVTSSASPIGIIIGGTVQNVDTANLILTVASTLGAGNGAGVLRWDGGVAVNMLLMAA